MIPVEEYLSYVGSSASSEQLVLRLLRHVCASYGFSYGGVWSVDSSRECLTLEAAFGYVAVSIADLSRIDLRSAPGRPRGISARALQERRPVTGTSDDPDYVLGAAEVVETLAIPVVTREGVVAVLTLERGTNDAPFPREFPAQHPLVVDAGLLYAAMTLRAKLLLDFERALADHQGGAESKRLRDYAEWLRSRLGFDHCSLYRAATRHRRSVLVEEAHASAHGDSGELERVAFGEDLIGWVAANKAPLRILDANNGDSAEFRWYGSRYPTLPRPRVSGGSSPRYRFAAAPLMHDRMVVGALALWDDDRSGRATDRELAYPSEPVLEALAASLTGAVSAGRALRTRLGHGAFTDPLNDSVTFEDLVVNALAHAMEPTGATVAYLALRDRLAEPRISIFDSDSVSAHHAVDEPRRLPSLVGRAFRDGELVRVPAGDRLLSEPVLPTQSGPWARSAFCIPLRAAPAHGAAEIVGALIVGTDQEEGLSAIDEEYLCLLAARLRDRFVLIQLRAEVTDLQDTVSRWEQAAESGVLAASEVHNTRKFLKQVAPKVGELVKHRIVAQSPDLHKLAADVSAGFAQLTGQADRFQRFLTSGYLPRVEIDLRAFLRAFRDDVINRVQLAHAQIFLAPDEETLPVTIEPIAIKAVLLNLVSNSLEAAARTITVRASRAATPRGAAAEVTVADDGNGIPESEWETVFLPFHSARGQRRRGSGLGLWAARKTVTEHGGAITVRESRPRERTVLCLTLPLTRTEQPHREGA